ncbi:DUF4142 domain-containing protein [Thermithiobacillus tepidarius DSM 3134]|uniref:DUF4142 domain-containing protein n=1 Tax=Thermithiobacillus tepidarius TaxID=929 RepID=UPI00041E55E1|nr:DUF4142 domain-containing protein [Thermithiobacillus tepidarius]
MMNTRTILGNSLMAGMAAALLFFSPASHAQAQADRAFMEMAAQGGMAEVQMGQMATRQAADPDVKQFGQRMVDDHGKANAELKQLAQKKGVTLPDDTDKKHKDIAARLAKLKGAEFDRAYMAAMVKDHQEDVTHFENKAKNAKDADVKAWAGKTLPVLKEHLQMAESLHARLAKSGSK